MYDVIERVLQNLSTFKCAMAFRIGSSIAVHFLATCIFVFLLSVIIGLWILFIRNRLFTVECWFCGCSQQVLWKERKSFTCIHCDQYNGFTSDGGYDKSFDAYHQSNLSVRYASINQNVFPSLVEWLSSKRRKSNKRMKTRRSHRLSNSNLQSNLSHTCPLPKWLYLLTRGSSLFCFLFLTMGTVISILIMRFCTVSTKVDRHWASKLIELVYPISLNITSQSCPHLIRMSPFFILPDYGWLWFAILLFIMQGIITGIDSLMYNRNPHLESLFDRFVANPFVLLCDLSLFVLSGNVLLNTVLKIIGGSFNTSLFSSGRYTVLTVMLMVSMLLVFASYSGLKTWLSFCSHDLRRQKQTLREHWPNTSLRAELPLASQFIDCSSDIPSHNRSPVRKAYQPNPSTLHDIPREFSSLSISRPVLPHKRSLGSITATDFRPSLLSANKTSGSKAAFDSKRSDYTLFSCPTVLHKPPSFVPSDTLYNRCFAHSDSDECDENSLVTSVSRTKRHSMSPRSDESTWQSDCGWCTRSRRRRKKNRRRRSLLRFCLTFLFGRLESWNDIVSELTYLLNALLLGSIIYGVCRLLLCLLQL